MSLFGSVFSHRAVILSHNIIFYIHLMQKIERQKLILNIEVQLCVGNTATVLR